MFRRVAIRNSGTAGVPPLIQELSPSALTCRTPQGMAIPFPPIREAVLAMQRYCLRIEWLEDFRVKLIAIQSRVANKSLGLIPDVA